MSQTVEQPAPPGHRSIAYVDGRKARGPRPIAEDLASASGGFMPRKLPARRRQLQVLTDSASNGRPIRRPLATGLGMSALGGENTLPAAWECLVSRRLPTLRVGISWPDTSTRRATTVALEILFTRLCDRPTAPLRPAMLPQGLRPRPRQAEAFCCRGQRTADISVQSRKRRRGGRFSPNRCPRSSARSSRKRVRPF